MIIKKQFVTHAKFQFYQVKTGLLLNPGIILSKENADSYVKQRRLFSPLRRRAKAKCLKYPKIVCFQILAIILK